MKTLKNLPSLLKYTTFLFPIFSIKSFSHVSLNYLILILQNLRFIIKLPMVFFKFNCSIKISGLYFLFAEINCNPSATEKGFFTLICLALFSGSALFAQVVIQRCDVSTRES